MGSFKNEKNSFKNILQKASQQFFEGSYFILGLKAGLTSPYTIMCSDVFQKRIVQFLIKKGANREEAVMIFDESVVRILEKIKKNQIRLNLDSKFYSYFLGYCKNIWFTEIKRKKRYSNYSPLQELGIEAENNIEQSFLQKERQSIFKQLCQSLSPKDQQILKLCFDEKSAKEIANAFNTSTGYIGKRRNVIKGKLTARFRILFSELCENK